MPRTRRSIALAKLFRSWIEHGNATAAPQLQLSERAASGTARRHRRRPRAQPGSSRHVGVDPLALPAPRGRPSPPRATRARGLSGSLHAKLSPAATWRAEACAHPALQRIPQQRPRRQLRAASAPPAPGCTDPSRRRPRPGPRLRAHSAQTHRRQWLRYWYTLKIIPGSSKSEALMW